MFFCMLDFARCFLHLEFGCDMHGQTTFFLHSRHSHNTFQSYEKYFDKNDKVYTVQNKHSHKINSIWFVFPISSVWCLELVWWHPGCGMTTYKYSNTDSLHCGITAYTYSLPSHVQIQYTQYRHSQHICNTNIYINKWYLVKYTWRIVFQHFWTHVLSCLSFVPI